MPLVPLTDKPTSPKTTVAGIVAILAGALSITLQLINHDVRGEKVAVDIGQITAGVGLIKAKDHDK